MSTLGDPEEHWPVHASETIWDGGAPFSFRKDTISAPGKPDETFDRVLSFSGRTGAAHPLVLRCNEAGDAGIAALRDELGRVLVDHGIPHQPAGTAHMTLLYDRAGVAEQSIPPWRWTVQELALVHSHVGQGRHERRGTWALGSA